MLQTSVKDISGEGMGSGAFRAGREVWAKF